MCWNGATIIALRMPKGKRIKVCFAKRSMLFMGRKKMLEIPPTAVCKEGEEVAENNGKIILGERKVFGLHTKTL